MNSACQSFSPACSSYIACTLQAASSSTKLPHKPVRIACVAKRKGCADGQSTGAIIPLHGRYGLHTVRLSMRSIAECSQCSKSNSKALLLLRPRPRCLRCAHRAGQQLCKAKKKRFQKSVSALRLVASVCRASDRDQIARSAPAMFVTVGLPRAAGMRPTGSLDSHIDQQ